jgi:RNA polymerase sigma-70 factor (ECF subfamily)
MSSGDGTLLNDLIRRARDGDEAARNDLFERCRNYVAILASTQVESWLQAKVDASDLVQQTMLDMHRGLAQYRGDSQGQWLAWLRAILAHNAAEFVRQYRGTAKRQPRREAPRVRPALGASEVVWDPVDPGESPSQAALHREDDLRLADGLARLPADYRRVIQLRHLERLPFDEVAQRMERSRPAVQMLWMRAIRRLQQELGT